MDDKAVMAFPISVDTLSGKIEGASYEEAIRQSIQLILSTKKGERFLEPDFGCDLNSFVFRGTDYTTLKRIEDEVTESIKKWEKRISGLTVTAEADGESEGRINIDISYKINRLESKFSLIHVLHTY